MSPGGSRPSKIALGGTVTEPTRATAPSVNARRGSRAA